MGLMDILNGMQHGPRGAAGRSSSGMSPLTMALLGLLAYKAIRSFSGGSTAATPSSNAASDSPAPGGTTSGGLGLDDILGRATGHQSGGLGGLLGSLGTGGLGGLLSGGLGDLLEQFQR